MADTRPVVVFIHGGGVGPWMWRRQLEHFSSRYETIAPALPGHDPDAVGEFISHDQAVAQIAAELAPVAAGRRVAVVGFSLGGQTALELAARHPQLVDRLVVVSSLVHPAPVARSAERMVRWAAPLARNRSFAKLQSAQLRIPDELFEEYFALARAISASSLANVMMANFSFEAPGVLRGSTLPALFVWGSKEQRMVRVGLAELAAELGADTREYAGVGHGVSLAEPERFNAELEAWLSASGV